VTALFGCSKREKEDGGTWPDFGIRRGEMKPTERGHSSQALGGKVLPFQDNEPGDRRRRLESSLGRDE
jgi:hypothetical protein